MFPCGSSRCSSALDRPHLGHLQHPRPRWRISVDTAKFRDIRRPEIGTLFFQKEKPMGEGYSPGASIDSTLQLIRNGEGSYLLDL